MIAGCLDCNILHSLVYLFFKTFYVKIDVYYIISILELALELGFLILL